jgi:DNA-binding NtrC family response regulator
MDVHIVDDESFLRIIYVQMMNALNYQAQAFSCPDEYLKYMASAAYSPPKLGILSDVNMPAMSGYELMAAVRKFYPHSRFIIATGSPKEPTLDESACYYLVKPVRLEALEKVLRGASRCNESGARPDVIGCESIDDRREFCVNEWKCAGNSNQLGGTLGST